MRIIILNKNLETANDYSSAKFYYVDEAPVLTEVKNETLDNGTIVISNQTSKIELEPYDVVEIDDDDGNFIKYMCVDTYSETITSINPKIYRYEITLFSETKMLETIVLPNLKITKMEEYSYTIYDYIAQYMDEYCPKIRTVSGSNYQWVNRWNYNWTSETNHPNISTKFDVDCPEMQWNRPTLREVLNDLMMVIDCIPIIKNGRLDYMDLTETTGISRNEDEHINYITRSKSSEDYVSELHLNLVNVTNKQDSFVTKKEYITFTIPDENATMTTENTFIKTQYPIYTLKSVKIMVPIYGEGTPPAGQSSQVRKWYQLDLMRIFYNNEYVNLIYEYDEWITKKIAYQTNNPTTLIEWQDYQNWTLYYNRGENTISNFNSSRKFTWITTITSYLRQNIANLVGLINVPSGYTDYNANNISSSYYSMVFEIEYDTLEECVFRASKGENSDNNRIVVDNQTNSYVESYSQGFLEYQKANRLGNEQLQINARYPSGEEPMKIGDTYEDCIIYQCQYQYYKDHIEVNALATKNYILREYFTGVKSKIRSWQIVTGSEALTRHDLQKYYCEFSYTPTIEKVGLNDLDTYSIANYMCSPLTGYNSAPLRCVFVRTLYYTTPYPSNFRISSTSMKSYYCLDLINRVVGNSLVFTFKFNDNYWAGQSVHTRDDYNTYEGTSAPTRPNNDIYVQYSDIEFDAIENIKLNSDALKGGGLPMKQHSYVDETNGEFTRIEAAFANNMKVIPTFNVSGSELYYNEITPGTNWSEDSATITEQSKKFVYYLYQRPRVYESNFKWNGTHSYDYEEFTFTKSLHKDSQEITAISTQFEFSSNTTNICFTKNWITTQKAINNSGVVGEFVLVRTYAKSKYNFRNPNKLPDGDADNTYSGVVGVEKNSDSNNVETNLSSKITIVFDDGNTYETDLQAKMAVYNNLARYKCFYISMRAGQNDYLLLALNNVPFNNCKGVNKRPAITLDLNILRSRNKNIYDSTNHYLINRKM